MPKQFTTISQELFDKQSQSAISKNPLRKEVSLREVEVLSDDTIRVGDTNIPMNGDAFKGICKIVGLPVGFDKTFLGAFGHKARQALINRLKTAAQAKGNERLSLVVNPESKRIINIHPDPRNLVSNSTFLSMSSSMIDKYGLEVVDFTVSENGAVVINTMSPKNVWGIKGLEDEEFWGGIAFSNSATKGFQVSPFLHRLVCANGMIGTSFEENVKLIEMSPFQMERFWNSLNALADRGFRPLEFEEKVRLARNTKASLFELETAHNALRNASDAQHNELEAWVPLHTNRKAFQAHGIDTVMLNPSQKKGAKSGATVWDVINGVTHFATHDNGFKIDEFQRRVLQVQASQMLTKPYDMANIIASPF